MKRYAHVTIRYVSRYSTHNTMRIAIYVHVLKMRVSCPDLSGGICKMYKTFILWTLRSRFPLLTFNLAWFLAYVSSSCIRFDRNCQNKDQVNRKTARISTYDVSRYCHYVSIRVSWMDKYRCIDISMNRFIPSFYTPVSRIWVNVFLPWGNVFYGLWMHCSL